MSLTDDLALVTACRGRASWQRFPQWEITDAALSLIEDTLNRHAPDYPDEDSATGDMGDPGCPSCDNYASMKLKPWPCDDYRDHLAALRTIATALGVETG